LNQVLPPGTVLRERYKIIKLVGQGGAGAVYQAEDLRLEGRMCALKEVCLEPGASPEARAQAQRQFHQEASILARLDHPNLPKVSDYFSRGERDYLVMDFVAGQDLKEIVDEARHQHRFLPEEQVLTWARQLCDTLNYLHNQDPPVLHRDIKPANIKLTLQGQIKLVDFGLVKPLDPHDPRTITVVRGLGSLPYTPLEQYGGGLGHTDVRSDIYSLGAALYHLLTGRAPATAQERFLDPDSLVALRSLNPHVSPRTEQVILQAMAMHPDQRPASVAEVQKALFSSMPLSDLFPSPLFPAQPLETALRENAPLIALALVLLFVAILVTWQAPSPLPTTLPFP
jgi:serine/threonine protein kinase